MKNNIDTVFQWLTDTKLRKLYYVSFWFGIVYLVSTLLIIPGWILLLHSQGINFTDFVYLISTNSLITNLNEFANLISGILISILIISTSWFLIHNKMKATQATTIGVVGLFVLVFTIVILLIISGVLMIALWSSFQNMINSVLQVDYWTSWVRFVLLLGSVLLLTGSYLKEKIDSSPRKYPQIVLPSLALLIIIFLCGIRFFR